MSGSTVMIKQNQLMRRFTQADAISPHSAKSLEAIRVRDGFIFRRMTKRGVFVKTEAGTYYMDLEAATAFRAVRMKIVFAMLVIGALILAVVFALTKR